MTEPILEIENLSKSFGDNHVLSNVNLVIHRGSITTILGKSGTGKSVLLKCIAGLMAPDSGSVRFDGRDISGRRDRASDAPEMSYLFQGNALFESMSARENVALPLLETTRLKRDEIYKRVDAILEQLELADAAGRSPADLSGGMRRRVSLARALIKHPDLVLFDEPTSGLDPLRRGAVLEMILRYKQDFGYTALVVSHDIPESIYISDEIALLDGGSFVFRGTPSELEADSSPAVRSFLDSEKQFKNTAAGVRPMSDLLAGFRDLRDQFDQLISLTIPSSNSKTAGAGEESDIALPGIMRRILDALRPVREPRSDAFRTGPASFCFATGSTFGPAQIREILGRADLKFPVQIRSTAIKKDQDIGNHLDTLNSRPPFG
jgi:phospholipid/cholesterol/gamma-HCH transport system ATP-binding protein